VRNWNISSFGGRGYRTIEVRIVGDYILMKCDKSSAEQYIVFPKLVLLWNPFGAHSFTRLHDLAYLKIKLNISLCGTSKIKERQLYNYFLVL
jgi:hypothetical protein